MGWLSPRNLASSGSGWRRRHPDMEAAANILDKLSCKPKMGSLREWCWPCG